jgi:hypothetical protein
MLTTLPASTRRKISERPVLILTVLTAFALTAAAQAKHKTASPAPATQEISWPKWKFSFTAPSTWRQYLEHIEDNKKVPNGNHDETRYFTRTPDRPNVYPTSDLTITFTTWPGPEFTVTRPSGQVLSISLEDFFALEQGTPETWQPQLKNPQFQAVRYETLDGIKGVLVQWSVLPVSKHVPTEKLVLSWNGYRLFEGNLQRITASFECTRADLPRAETILHSFNFSK